MPLCDLTFSSAACPKVIDAVLLLQNCRYSSEEKVFPEFTD